jgi:glycosyltransferase involved in cell wall biosynthesis
MNFTLRKISVIVPTYKRPALLKRCLDALTSQVFRRDEYEIIVVSDGLDADTELLMMGYTFKSQPSVRYAALPKKGGPAAARNLGWQMATAELIAFTDDDCIPHEYWLMKIWSAAAHLNLIRPMAFSGKTIVPIPENPSDYELNISNLEKAEFITANCMCTKKALQLTGGFDERFTMAWREDSDLQFNLISKKIPIIQVPDAVVHHPVRKASWGKSIWEEKKGMFNALLYHKYPRLYRERIEPKPRLNYYAMVLSLLLFIAGLLAKLPAVSWVGFGIWLLLTLSFASKRLSRTSKNFDHILEMLITSAIIPILSVFYRLYGAWKFRSLAL